MEQDKSVMGKKVGRRGTCVACGLEKPATFIQFFDSSAGLRNKLSKLVERWADVDFACTGGALCRNCHRRAAYIDGRASQFAKSCMTHGYQRYGGKLMTGIKLPREVYDHWHRVGVAENLTSDTDIAIFLIQQFESPTEGVRCTTCDTPVKLTRVVCSSCKQRNTQQAADAQGRRKETPQPTEPPGKDSFTVSLLTSTASVQQDLKPPQQTSTNEAALHHLISPDTSAAEQKNSVPHQHDSTALENFGDINEDSQTTDDRKEVSKDTSVESEHEERSGSSGANHLADHDYVMPLKGFRLTPAMFTVEGEKVTLPDADLLVHAKGQTSSGTARRFILPKGPLPRVEKEKFSFLSCKVCSCCFNSNAALQLHVQSHKLGGTFNCKFCDLTFKDIDYRTQHEEIHKQPRRKKYVCHLCDRTLQSSAGFIAHLKSHCRKPPGPFSCSQCDRTFTRRFGLQEHLRVHSGAKPYCCKFCEKSFRWPNKLRDHVRSTHSSEDARRFVCETCGKRFLQNWLLKHHMRLHRQEPVCMCELCGKGFYNQTSLWTHLELQHNDKSRMTEPVICEHCAGAFSSKTVLSAHQRKSSCMAKRAERDGVNPFSPTAPSTQLSGGCCGSKWVKGGGESQGNLADKILQGPEGALTCIDCGQQFQYEKSLVDHKSCSHPTEKAHKFTSHGKCAELRKKRAHSKTHRKFHQCKICGKVMTEAQGLKHHMLTHSGERPFKCSECASAFRDRQSWRHHIQCGHKPECKPYVCEVCDVSYRSRHSLRQHRKKTGHGVVHTTNGASAFNTKIVEDHIEYVTQSSVSEYISSDGQRDITYASEAPSVCYDEHREVIYVSEAESSLTEINSEHREIIFVSDTQFPKSSTHACSDGQIYASDGCSLYSACDEQICVSESQLPATQISDAMLREAAFVSQAKSNKVTSLPSISGEANSVPGPVTTTEEMFVTDAAPREITYTTQREVNQNPFSSTLPSTQLSGGQSGAKWVDSVPGVSGEVICTPQSVSGREVMLVPESGRSNVPCSVLAVDPSTLPDTEGSEGQIGLWVLI